MRDAEHRSDRRAAVTATVAAVTAFGLLVAAPLVPGVLSAGTPSALVGVPVEAIAVLLLLLSLPSRALRLAVAIGFGILVVAATLVAALDLAFRSTVDRPFSAAQDLPQLAAAVGVVADAAGVAGVVGVVVVLAALVAGFVLVLARAALWAGDVARASGRSGRRLVAVVSAVWIAGALAGSQLVPGIPLAAADATGTIAATSAHAVADLREQRAFERAMQTDAAAGVPAADLLTGLEGKDVVVAFIESYGRVALEGPDAGIVRTTLGAGAAQLRADGYAAQSAFLTSPTFGGVSWLAHATLQSGVWVDSQRKYDLLTSSDRVTLSSAFERAGWRTVAVVPSNRGTWPTGRDFYGFDGIVDSRSMGYRGPSFSYARVPDQFTWQVFHDRELAAPHEPVMAEIDFVSSHTPWTPLPSLVPWADLGDGSVFEEQAAQGDAPVVAWQDAERVRELYAQSIAYSLGALFSYLHEHPQRDLVLVVVGDHQPARIVSGEDADHDVPITVIAQDPDVFARIAAWNWQPGVIPSPEAPVWPMDAFRDRFLDAFGSTDGGL